MHYFCYNNPPPLLESPISPITVDPSKHKEQRMHVLARIAEKLHLDKELRKRIVATGCMPLIFDTAYGLPSGYVYHLDALTDFPDLLSVMKHDMVWWGVCMEFQAMGAVQCRRSASVQRLCNTKSEIESLHACVTLAIKTAMETAS